MSKKEEFKTIETLVGEDAKLIEIELMVTPKELQIFAKYCLENEIKFNDWIRELAYERIYSDT